MADPVNTDDLIQSAIERRAAIQAQRQQIAQQRSQIAQQLSSAGGRRDRGRRASLQAQLGNLGAAEREINSQERDIERTRDLQVHSALRNHAMATKDTEDALHAQVADQAVNIHRGMLQLQAQYPNRFSDANQAAKFHDGMVQLTNDNPMGLQNNKTAAAVMKVSQFHDAQVEKQRNQLATRLFKETGLSPEQFATGVNDRATNTALRVPSKEDPKILVPPTLDQIKQGQATNGRTVAMEVNGVTHLFDRGLFDNLNQTFRSKPEPQAVTVPATPDQQAQAAGFRSTEQAQGYREGNPLLDYAPAGTATTERSIPMSSGPTPSGGFVSTGKIQPYEVGAQDTRTATLPAGVEPNAPIVPTTQLPIDHTISDKSGIEATVQPAPQVATQPVAQPTAQPTTTPTTDLTALAQRALNDPSATEEHKARARQILGLQ